MSVWTHSNRIKFAYLTGGGKLEQVLHGIEAAKNAGLNPVKTNMVVLKGINDGEIPDFAQKTITDGWHVRFIEYMPFDGAKAEVSGFMSSGEIMDIIRKRFGKLEPHHPTAGNGRLNISNCPVPMEPWASSAQ